jgi:hypothetical protein
VEARSKAKAGISGLYPINPMNSMKPSNSTNSTDSTNSTNSRSACLLTNPTPNPRLLTGFQEYLMLEIKVREVKARCPVYNGEGKNPGDIIRIDEPKNASSVINKLGIRE